MKNANAEIIKTNRTETVNLTDMVTGAQQRVEIANREADQTEEEARSLELELIEAQAVNFVTFLLYSL